MSKKFIKDLFIIIIGNFLVALSVQYFILPYDILTGGVAGVALVIRPFIPWVSEELIINILVVGLFLIGWLVLGKDFAIKTVVSSIVYPIFISLLSFFPIQLDISPLLASIYVGLLSGVGIGLVLRVGASTGGMDIPPLILNHYTGIETSKFILLCDGLTCIFGLMNYSLEALLNGLISVLITSVVIDKIEVSYGDSSLSVQIISNAWQDINREILSQLNRGVSIIEINGGYTMEKRRMLLVIIDKREYSLLLKILDKYDKNAFVITNDVQSVHGEGFKLTYRI